MAEMLDGLKSSVFVDLEIVFGESGNQGAFVVKRRCLQNHHVHAYANGVVVGCAGKSREKQDSKRQQTSERRGTSLFALGLVHF
jgi:hypothetical protein